MSQQMLGVLQPRPVSTLHVGGGLKTDGAISAQSLGVTGNATVSGTLGVTGATTLSTLGVTGATTLAALTAGTSRLGRRSELPGSWPRLHPACSESWPRSRLACHSPWHYPSRPGSGPRSHRLS